jgi:hypothetical protein
MTRLLRYDISKLPEGTGVTDNSNYIQEYTDNQLTENSNVEQQ